MVTPMEYVSIPHDLPEFFKIYHPEIYYTQLRIPPAFLKFFNGDIPSNAVLETLAARSWHVVVEKDDADFFFKEGWQDFVQENKLEFGEFLTFSYAGNSKFYVKMYEKNGSLKTDVTADKELELVPLDEENAQEKGIVARPVDQALNVSGDSIASITSFEVVILKSHLQRGRLNMPAAFGNRYMNREQPFVATLQIGKASWQVKVLTNDRFEFQRGIHKFMHDTALRENDVCRFKLIDEEKFILKVRIRRYPN